jgi:TatD DNase family protein
MRSAECVAFGECGLDFSRDFSPKETQIQVFEKQLQMASHLSRTERIQKPLLVREVDAFAEWSVHSLPVHSPHLSLLPSAALLRQYAADLPQIVVQFRGTEEHARQYLDVGAFLALSGLVFKDKSEDGVRRLLRSKGVPLSRLRESCFEFEFAVTSVSF